jgi:hypothetical protein
MIGAVLVFVAVVAVTILLLLAIAIAWGGLTWKDLPAWSAGDEPTNVRLLPEIDIPLGPGEDDDD